MSGTTKENPLLFSANASSPFDDISSSALLLPPSQQPPKVTEPSSKEPEAADAFSQSLQPHLEKNNFPAPPVTPIPRLSPSTVPLLPPSVSPQGGPLLRRSTNKYVVPPEISAVPSVPRPPASLPQHPPFATPHGLPPTVHTFTPLPSYDLSSASTHDYSLPTPEGHTVAQLAAADFTATVGDNVYQHPNPATVIPASFSSMAENPPLQDQLYHPVIPHWFFSDGKPVLWKPFSFTDSLNLEEAYRQGVQEKVATDGGRYDVFVRDRKRLPIYWEGDGGSVRRCSWFRKSYSEAYPIPYDEDVAQKLEAEYKNALITGQWHRQIELPAGERVMLNSPFSMHHYAQEPTELPNITSVSESQSPQTIKRGADDFEIKEGASERVDHLLFLIHGIGSVCDLSFRSVEECVDDFRAMGEDLLAIHFKESIESGKVGRVEILPISWHKALHGDATGLDEKLKFITLRSIPKFREFTNDTLLDVLFFTSPVYCQHIMDTVASEMERQLTVFRKRNPTFGGDVSVGGHSLGSVILFDLLMHQNPTTKEEGQEQSEDGTKDNTTISNGEGESVNGDERSSSTSQINFRMGVAGTGQPAIVYPQLSFHPQAIFLMGSPVGMFITVRGIDNLGPSFKLPTCDRVLNIFHPFDPVAYRLEPLIDASFVELRPVLIPHHKGRKRMHLELKDTIERVGADIKNKIVDSIQSTWNKFYQMYAGSRDEYVRAEMEQAVEESMLAVNDESGYENMGDHKVGQLNRGMRVDYVLQEKPYESFTEYIFALQAHVTYWSSEDTLLMIFKELYKLNGIKSDVQPVQQNTINRSSKPEAFISSYSESQKLSPPPSAPSAPVPMFSSSVSSPPQLPPPPAVKSDIPRTLRGRPVFDPLNAPVTAPGMDPTASPSGCENLARPPPILPKMSFNRKKT